MNGALEPTYERAIHPRRYADARFLPKDIEDDWIDSQPGLVEDLILTKWSYSILAFIRAASNIAPALEGWIDWGEGKYSLVFKIGEGRHA